MADDLRGGTVLADRYRLVAPIARGGMAEVWESVDEVLSRGVAVKVLFPHLAADGHLRERFRREAVAAARLSHPNIVATFDTGNDDVLPYIVMELVRGPTLRDELRRVGPLDPTRAARIAMRIAEALEHAHGAGVVHRDVKPGNILLPAGDQVKVADFGIAKAAWGAGDDLTQPGTLLGTARYLAPEQAQGDEPDARSDIYSLGVVLYEMVCGRAPFEGDTDVATAYAHVHATPPRPRELRAGMPRGLEEVILRAIEKDPAKRFGSAGELRAALAAADTGADDAIPAVVREPTPPTGVPVVLARSERSWLVTAGVIVVIAAAVAIAGVALSRSDVGRDLVDQVRRRPPAEALAVVEARSFDPEGDGAEDEDEVGLAHDGDAATEWSSDRYNGRDFGGLKTGLGIWFRIDGRAELTRVTVETSSPGWNADVYVADEAAPQLSGWGEAAATGSATGSTVTFDLEGADGQVILLWFTRLGPGSQVAVSEVVLEGR